MFEVAHGLDKFIFSESWFDLHCLSLNEQGREPPESLDSFLEDYSLNDETLMACLWIVWAGDMPVGHLFSKNEEIVDIWVAPLFRSQKIGHALFSKFLERRSKDEFLRFMSPTTSPLNETFKSIAQPMGLVLSKHVGTLEQLKKLAPSSLSSAGGMIFFNAQHQPYWKEGIEKLAFGAKWKLREFEGQERGLALVEDGKLIGGILYRALTLPKPKIEILCMGAPDQKTELELLAQIASQALSLDIRYLDIWRTQEKGDALFDWTRTDYQTWSVRR